MLPHLREEAEETHFGHRRCFEGKPKVKGSGGVGAVMWVRKVVMEAFWERHFGQELKLCCQGGHVHKGGGDVFHLGDCLFLGGEGFSNGPFGFAVKRKGLKGEVEVANVHRSCHSPGLFHDFAVGGGSCREEEHRGPGLSHLEGGGPKSNESCKLISVTEDSSDVGLSEAGADMTVEALKDEFKAGDVGGREGWTRQASCCHTKCLFCVGVC